MNKNWFLIIFGLSGMAALIYEITWIRPLSLVFGTTIYAVSTIVAAFILGLALGSWIAGRYTDKLKNPLKYFAFLQIGIGFYGIFLLPVFSILPEVYVNFYQHTYPNQHLFVFIQVLMAISMISVPATMIGTTLPLMMKNYSQSFTSIGKDVGKLDASNSVGAVIGTLAAGFFMIPILGIQTSIVITAIVNIGLGIAILLAGKYLSKTYIAAIGIIAVAFLIGVPSYDIATINQGVYAHNDPIYFTEISKEIFKLQTVQYYEESLYSTVVVFSFPGDVTRLTINGKTQCSNSPHVIEGLNNFASIPYELFEYNYGKPQNALNVGLGCGATSKWLSEHVNTTTVEIDPAVPETTGFFFDHIDHDLIIDDARNWMLRNDVSFDIITTEPFDPWVNNGGMYTLEYFVLLNKTLSENGLVSQWVPNFEMTEEDYYILYNTFHTVFPYVYVYQMELGSDLQWIFIGSQKPLQVKENELYLYNHEKIETRETILSTDDRPVLEFSTAQNIYD